jgi:hypothetical protein
LARRSSKRQSLDLFPIPLSAAAVFSFLKQTRGSLSWTAGDLAATLHISASAAKRVLAAFELQGYAKREGANWTTTGAGETVSGSRMPRFKPEAVKNAVEHLTEWIKVVNKDPEAAYRITGAVAFGDFLEKRETRAQAADVGIKLEPKRTADPRGPVAQHRSKLAFLRYLRGRSAVLNLREFEDWMSERSNQRLL